MSLMGEGRKYHDEFRNIPILHGRTDSNCVQPNFPEVSKRRTGSQEGVEVEVSDVKVEANKFGVRTGEDAVDE